MRLCDVRLLFHSSTASWRDCRCSFWEIRGVVMVATRAQAERGSAGTNIYSAYSFDASVSEARSQTHPRGASGFPKLPNTLPRACSSSQGLLTRPQSIIQLSHRARSGHDTRAGRQSQEHRDREGVGMFPYFSELVLPGTDQPSSACRRSSFTAVCLPRTPSSRPSPTTTRRTRTASQPTWPGGRSSWRQQQHKAVTREGVDCAMQYG